MNYKLTLTYDGTDFNGWQVQLHKHLGEQRTVQGEVQRACEKLEGRLCVVHGAGRTDAGVHAEAQVASVELKREMTNYKLRAALNALLPRDVRVTEAEQVADDFHARFSATGKTYRYRIFNARFASPFLARFALTEGRELDVEAMRAATEIFVGTHDFTAFSNAQSSVKDRVRNVTKIDVCDFYHPEARGRVIDIRVTANGFLHFMVRSIVGTLIETGRGAMTLAIIEQALQTGDRSLAGATAAAHGLTLVNVSY